MANPFYAPGAERAARVGDLFARIAPRYDLLNDLQSLGLHRWWKRKAVRLAAPGPGRIAADLCCGTGDLALALARAGATVTGVDFSQPMLNVALARALRPGAVASGCPQPHFICGDTLKTGLSRAEFDIVTMGYGLRNLTDWRAGLLEMARLLRPGGRLVILEFGKPANRLWRAIYFGYLRLAVPCLGRIFCGDAAAYGYILESLKHYPGQESVAEELRRLGFGQLRVINLLGGAMAINYGERIGPP